MKRVLLEEIAWSEYLMGELGLLDVTRDVEIDGDKKTVRIYQIG